MWRCWVLAAHWRRIDMLGIACAMADGSYWAESIHDYQDFPEPRDPGGYE